MNNFWMHQQGLLKKCTAPYSWDKSANFKHYPYFFQLDRLVCVTGKSKQERLARTVTQQIEDLTSRSHHMWISCVWIPFFNHQRSNCRVKLPPRASWRQLIKRSKTEQGLPRRFSPQHLGNSDFRSHSSFTYVIGLPEIQYIVSSHHSTTALSFSIPSKGRHATMLDFQ